VTTSVSVPGIRFKIRLTRDPNGTFTVECPTLPGCISQGSSKREAVRNIREAIQAWIEGEQEARRRGWKPVWERGSR